MIIYSIGDAIGYTSENGDQDTIRIIALDSIENCGQFGRALPSKELKLHIEFISSQTKLEQAMIVIEKHNETDYSTWIQLLDFNAKLIDSSNSEVDTLVDLNASIKEVYWSSTYGIIGYKKAIGTTYLRSINY